MKYAYTILYVPNVKASIEFYEKAFGFQEKFITPENSYGELISGGDHDFICFDRTGPFKFPAGL